MAYNNFAVERLIRRFIELCDQCPKDCTEKLWDKVERNIDNPALSWDTSAYRNVSACLYSPATEVVFSEAICLNFMMDTGFSQKDSSQPSSKNSFEHLSVFAARENATLPSATSVEAPNSFENCPFKCHVRSKWRL